MSKSVYFNGENITIPGAYSNIDTTAMTGKSGSQAKIIAIIGESDGGEPSAVQFFTSPSAARRVLKGGELLKAMEKAWNPVSGSKEGVSLNGASTIACIRTNAGTKSTYTFKNGNNDVCTVESKDWGSHTNYQLKLDESDTSRCVDLVVYDQANDYYETFAGLGDLFTIKYTGTAAYAVLSITKSNGVLTLQTKTGADADSATADISLTLDPKLFKSIPALINELSAYENYTVTAGNFNGRLSVTDIDPIAATSIATGDGQALRVTAVLADMANKLKVSSNLVQVKTSNNAYTLQDTDGAYVAMTGGTAGATPSSWATLFDKLSNFDIFYIVPLTSDASIHAELLTHIEEMSGNIGKERRGIVGGAINESVTDVIQRSRELSSARMQVVYGGFYDIDNATKQSTLYPPYMLAAQHAGRAAGLDDGEPATHDVYRMSAPEFQLERDDIAQLIDGGVLAFEYVLGRTSSESAYTRLVWDLTTDTTHDDSVHVERATGALADSINREIREALDAMLTGKRAGNTDVTSAKNRVISILQERQRKEHIVAFKGVTVEKEGTVTTVDYNVAPSEPNNFTLITAHFYSEPISL